MLLDKRLQIRARARVLAERELRLGSCFEGREAELLETRDLGLGEALVGELRQRRAAPEGKCVGQGLEVSALDRALEALAIELAFLDTQHVAGRPGDEPVAELLPEQGDVVTDDFGRGRRRRLAPELVDEAIDRDRFVGVQKQQRDQRELPAAPEAENPTLVNDLERTEDSELQARLLRATVTPAHERLDADWRELGRPMAARSQCRLRTALLDRKEHGMRNAFIIVITLVIAATAAGVARAGGPSEVQRIIAQERAKGLVVEPTPQTAVHSIIAQELGRHSDPRLFQPSGSAPVQVVGSSDGFDFADAGIGGAMALALSLLVAAAATLRNRSHRGFAVAGSMGARRVLPTVVADLDEASEAR